MPYQKPTLAVVGNASTLVQFGSPYKNPGGNPDACFAYPPGGLCPAYEVDD